MAPENRHRQELPSACDDSSGGIRDAVCVFGGRDIIAASHADLDVQELVDDGRGEAGGQA